MQLTAALQTVIDGQNSEQSYDAFLCSKNTVYSDLFCF